jgi:hypothetical protein
MGGGNAADNLWTRVPEGVAAADGDDGGAGSGGGQELGRGGGAAAVVADLEKRDWMDAVGGEHGAFAWGFGVAFKQSGGGTIVDAK